MEKPMHYVIKTQDSNPAEYCTDRKHVGTNKYIFSQDIEQAMQFSTLSRLARFCGRNHFDAVTIVKVESTVTLTEL